MRLQLVRYALAISILFVAAVLLLVIGLSVARGVPLTAPSLAGFTTVVGTLLALVINLLGTQQTLSRVVNVQSDQQQLKEGQQALQDKVDGHLDDHMDRLSPEHMEQLADAAARKVVELQPPEPPAT